MSYNSTSFEKDDLNSLIKQFENSLQRSQIIASQANQINTLQTKQIKQFQTTMDKSTKHLQDVEREMDELEKGFCMRLCCPSKSKKSKSKNLSLKNSQYNQTNENNIQFEQDSTYTNQQFQNLDDNLQKLQYFNNLIDHEIQHQLQTLNELHHQVDDNEYKLTKANMKSRRLF